MLRALGARPAMTAADGLTGILGAVVAGSLLAVGVAVALSPVAPIGPVRPVYPSPGVAFDWTVLGLGFLALAGASARSRSSSPAAARRIAGPGQVRCRSPAAPGRRGWLPFQACRRRPSREFISRSTRGVAAARYRPVRPSPGLCLP